jgi:hypothetical protein
MKLSTPQGNELRLTLPPARRFGCGSNKFNFDAQMA